MGHSHPDGPLQLLASVGGRHAEASTRGQQRRSWKADDHHSYAALEAEPGKCSDLARLKQHQRLHTTALSSLYLSEHPREMAMPAHCHSHCLLRCVWMHAPCCREAEQQVLMRPCLLHAASRCGVEHVRPSKGMMTGLLMPGRAAAALA